jgi:hypothetical protein
MVNGLVRSSNDATGHCKSVVTCAGKMGPHHSSFFSGMEQQQKGFHHVRQATAEAAAAHISIS